MNTIIWIFLIVSCGGLWVWHFWSTRQDKLRDEAFEDSMYDELHEGGK